MAQHAARLDIGLHIILEERVDAGLHDILIARLEVLAEPARELEVDERGEALLRGRLRALLPGLGRILAVPARRIDEGEAADLGRMVSRECKCDRAAHGRPRDDGLVPAEVVDEIGDVVGEKGDGVWAFGLVRRAMAAAVEGHRAEALCHEQLCDWSPVVMIHGERVDQDRALRRAGVAMYGIGNVGLVPGGEALHGHAHERLPILF